MKLLVGSDGAFETVLDVRVDDSEHGGRTWTPVEADLSKWGGKQVILRLELEPEVPILEPELSWWGSPRVAGPRAGRQQDARAQPAGNSRGLSPTRGQQ
jgi:hypothetical protein